MSDVRDELYRRHLADWPLIYGSGHFVSLEAQYKRSHDGRDPSFTDIGHPPPSDIALGDWRGHFLTADFFFPPAIKGDWKAYLSWYAGQGYRTVLLNAEQHDWGPSKGHPEWTDGGYTAYRSDVDMVHFVSVLEEARDEGLIPIVGVVDQPALHDPIESIIDRSKRLVEATHEHVALYMLSWEIREVWRDSTEREANEDRWIGEVDWHGRDVGIHYQAASKTIEDEDPGLGGGINRYQALENIYPGHVTRLLQFHNEAPRDVMEEQVRRTAGTVHAEHGLGKWACFEHSSELNQPKTYTRAEVGQRGLPKDRCGYMN
jgi:hypothetical protein